MDDVTKYLAELSSEKRALFVQTLLEHGENFNAFPLSFAQQRLWFLDQWAPGTPAYHLPGALRLNGPLDYCALRRSLRTIVARHEILRTIFVAFDGQPLQIVQLDAPLRMPLIDLRALPAAARAAYARRLALQVSSGPFDLARGPLLRTTLLRLSAETHTLLLTLHHIVADGWSLELLLDELAALYAAYVYGTPAELPELPIQYADYALWERERLRGPERERLLAYWRERLAGAPPLLNLPADHPRPPAPSLRGARYVLMLDGTCVAGLRALSRRAGTTPFMTLLAAFNALLYRYSGQDDIVVGTPIAGRARAEAAPLIGCFVNMLALRTDLSGDPRFGELLERVRAVCLGAYAHQDLPFEQLVAALQPGRELDHAPLAQVLFSLLPAPLPPLEAADIAMQPFAVEHGAARLDLALDLVEAAEGMQGWLEYSVDLFEAPTIMRLARHLRALLDAIIADPERRLLDLPLLSKSERQQLLVEWNDTAVGIGGRGSGVRSTGIDVACVHELIAAQAANTPDAVAVVYDDERRTTNDKGSDSSFVLRHSSAVVHLTYQELNRRANQLAQHLRGLGVGPETRVGVYLERSPELIVALLAVHKAGGAYVPLDPSFPAERISLMLEDSGAAVVITTNDEGRTTKDERRRTNDEFSQLVSLSACQLVDLEAEWPTTARQPPSEPLSGVCAYNLAYVLYTSGSTSTPKGVMVTHAALANLLASMRQRAEVTSGDALLAVTTVAFDIAGLEMWLPLMVGARIMLANHEQAGDGAALAAMLARSRISVMQATPATWRLLLAASWRGQRELRMLCGGEALARELAEQLVGRGAALWNLYGPTETTIWSSAARVLDGAVSLGRPLDATQLYVLDRAMQPAPLGVAGELYIGGAGLARGYLGRPELTAAAFVPNPFGTMNDEDRTMKGPDSSFIVHRSSFGSRLYRTGDLARYRADGRLEYLGRLDRQLKLRGYRIEPEEIAAVLGRHAAVRASVVEARADASGELRLVAYIVQGSGVRDRGSEVPNLAIEDEGRTTKDERPISEDRGLKIEDSNVARSRPLSSIFNPLSSELRSYLAEHLPAYMLPGAFVILDALPLTPNGKLDRRALPAPEWTAEEAAGYVAPRTALEQRLAELWSELLGVERVGMEHNFFALGGHSLRATQLLARLRDAFGVEVSLQSFFAAPTVAALARRLERTRAQSAALSAPPLQPLAGDGEQPLSFAQQRLWFLDQLAPGSPVYTIPAAVRMNGSLDTLALRRSFAAIIRRHATLRTTFATRGGEPVQRIAASDTTTALLLPLLDLRGLPDALREDAARRVSDAVARSPFDLARGPLLRVALIRLAANEHLLLVILHHIIADGWSIGVLIREMATAYRAHVAGRAPMLPALPVQYVDFAAWQRARLAGPAREAQLAYWKAQLRSPIPVLALPIDRPRPAAQTFNGAQRAFQLPAPLSERLQALCRREDITLFMLQLAAFAALLRRHTGQDEILIGTPIAGRTHAAVEGLIGCFVNTLVLRTDLGGNPTFRELAGRARTVCLDAYAHQELPFELLLEELQPARDLSHTPLFQALLVLENAPDAPLDLPGLTLRPLPIDNRTAKFDLTLLLWERTDGLAGIFEYNTDLFDAATIERLLGHFQTLLAGVAADPARRLADLPLLTVHERQQVLIEWNSQADRGQGTGDRSIQELFAAQAAYTPDAVALCFDAGVMKDEGRRTNDNPEGAFGFRPSSLVMHLTYRELDGRANQLAHYLRRRGAGPGGPIGVAVERSPELVIGMLGVLKAGGAYVPLDPAYPAERISLMLEESGAALLITTGEEQRTTNDQRPTTNDDHLPTADWWLPTDKIDRLVTLSPYHLVNLGADWPAIAEMPDSIPANQTTAAGLAYVICTSGSTGRPKAAGVYHRGVVNLLRWWIADFAITAGDRILLVTSPSFDLTQKNIFAPLLVGATLHAPAGRYEPGLIVRAVHDRRITILNCTPSAFYPLIETLGERAPRQLASLRHVFLGGEPIDVARLRPWIEAAHCAAQVVNTYGPTECTDVVASYRLPRSADLTSALPIGRPVFNTALFVVDRDLNPAPIGVVGELCVGGRGVGAGYLGRPELTAAAFVPNPFARAQGSGVRDPEKRAECGMTNDEGRTTNDESEPSSFVVRPSSGTRLYKTGDLARYRADGAIEYLGRIDGQVKLRGYRIELGEVEATLRRHPLVREAVALVRADGPGEPRLVAYIVQGSGVGGQGSGASRLPRDDEGRTTNDEGPSLEDRRLKIEDSNRDAQAALSSILYPLSSELRGFLRERLPDYMIPSLFVALERLPLTPSGKIDRRALPAPDPAALADRQGAYVAPRTPAEEALASIWAELLGIERVGIHDNFFDLGGHSLLATRVLARINDAFDVELPLEVLFTNFTIAELARKVAQSQVTAAHTDELASMLQQLDSLSDDEVRQLLDAM